MIPCCFHPTRVVVIDDNYEFLCALDYILSRDGASYQYYNSPQRALAYLNQVQATPFPQRYVINADEEAWEHRRLDVNIFELHQEIYRPERFAEISVVVIDYSMPELNGLDFCQQLQDKNIQKILLTGMADEHIAIQAFNNGIIQHYIRKHDRDMVEQLNKAIEESQRRYFNKLSEVVIGAIRSVDVVDHAITDPYFQAFFKEHVKQHRFTEAYLCESMGSFLFLDNQARTHGLMVNIADQLDLWVESDVAADIEPRLLTSLKSRQKMICYHNRHGIGEPEAHAWSRYAQSVQQFQGQATTYYYATAPHIFDIEADCIVSFDAFKAANPSKIHT
jgi:CheY-like chemotaxis protein